MNSLNTVDRGQATFASGRSNITSEIFGGGEENVSVGPWMEPRVPERLFNLIKELGSERVLRKDEFLYGKDSCVHKLAVVIDGIIGKAMLDPQTVNTEAYAITTPFCLASGYLNFFSGRPCGQTCFAMTPARILECEADALKAELIKDPELFFGASAHFEMCAASDNIALRARLWPGAKMAKDRS